MFWPSTAVLATARAASKSVHTAVNGLRALHSSTNVCQQQLEAWSGFDVGIEQASTLPASWYTSPIAVQLEKQHVFYNTWQMVCCASQLQNPGDFLCGSLSDVQYLLVRGQDGKLRAFHNVCRHHAAAVARGCGRQLQFECPYHGWTYDDRGRLVKATRLKGIKDFKASQFGLHPIALDVWGHFVFLHLQGGRPPAADVELQSTTPDVAAWLGAGGQQLEKLGMQDQNLVHVARRDYVINCNWKVFCDNYLDGGYHVPFAHKDLAGGLDLATYRNQLYDVLSIQSCSVQQSTSPSAPSSSSSSSGGSSSTGDQQPSSGEARLSGRDAAYAFVYPNLMINRYGPWMDTNVVLPLTGNSVDKCKVVFDYWLEAEALAQAAAAEAINAGVATSNGCNSSFPAQQQQEQQQDFGPADDVIEAGKQSQFVAEALSSSHQVQVEDIALCEAVQLGLQEPAYGVGRYAPGPEAPMFHFHSQLYEQLKDVAAEPARR